MLSLFPKTDLFDVYNLLAEIFIPALSLKSRENLEVQRKGLLRDTCRVHVKLATDDDGREIIIKNSSLL